MAKKKESNYNNTLINALSPSVINFDKDGFDLGSFYCVGMTATRFPSKVKYEWLNDVCNLNNTMTCLSYTPEKSPDIILKEIGHNVSSNKLVADGTVSSDPVTQARAQKVVADGEKIIDQIANNNESIGQLSVSTIIIGKDKQDAKNKAKGTKNKFSGRMFNISTVPFMQKDVFKAVSPCDLATELQNDVSNQILPISTLWGGFPFAFAGYNDGDGSYFGKDNSGGLIVVDLWRRGVDRINSNLVMMGASGGGKSTALKHLLINEWEIGTKIIIIDPHGEYKELCNNLKGDWIDVVGGQGGRINPFHIYVKAKNPDEVDSLSELAKHINNLEVFFKLYLDLNPSMVACLKQAIELTYFSKGITWETDVSKLRPEQYPIMEDLYNICCEQANEVENSLKRSETNYYKELSLLLRNIAFGSDSFLWNGPSNVNTTKDIVVFDTSAVNNNASNIKTTLYHTILNYCEDYLYRNRHERVILVCDEAHNVIDKRLPETLIRLSNIEKSCRKFESGIWICSQQLIDFLDEAIKKEGQTLLDLPNIKILMPIGKGRDLKEIKELYELTDAEEEILMQQQRGIGLLFIGSRRLIINFEIPQHHFELMGTGGGR